MFFIETYDDKINSWDRENQQLFAIQERID